MKQWLQKNSVALMLGVLAFLPAIATYETIFPYHIGKWLWVLGIVLIGVMTSSYVLLKEKKSFPITATVVGLWVLIGVRILSGFWGVDLHKSFFGDALRLTGTTTWIIFTMGAVALATYLREHPEKRIWVWYTLLYSGVFVSLTGWLVQFNNGIFGVRVGVEGLAGRFIGLFGNETYFGAHIMLCALAGLALFFEEKNKTRKIWATLLTLFVVLTVIVAKTRAGGIGLLAGFITFTLYALGDVRSRLVKIGAVVGLVAVFLFGSLWVVAQREFFGTVESVAMKIISISGIETRIYFWKTAYTAFLEKPILGWGPENYEVAYDRYYPVGLVARANASLYETWGERPHNIFFEYLVSQGIVGITLFLVAIGLLLWKCGTFTGKEKYGARTVAAMVVAYLAFGSLTFDTPSVLFLLFLGFAVLISLEKEWVPTPNVFKKIIPVTAILASAILLVVCVIQPYQEMKLAGTVQNGLSARALSDTYRQDVERLMEEDSVFHRESLKSLADEVINNARSMSDEVRMSLLQNLYVGLQQEMKKNPHLFSVTLRFGQIAGFLAEFDVAQRETYEAESRAAFARARELSPDRHIVDVAEMRLFLSLEKPAEVIKFQENVARIGAPSITYFLLSLAHDGLGNSAEAAKNLGIALDKKYPVARNAELIQYLVGILEKEQYYEYIVILLKRVAVPNDYRETIDTAQTRFQIALALANLGRMDESISAANSALELDPSLKDEVENFLAKVRNNP